MPINVLERYQRRRLLNVLHNIENKKRNTSQIALLFLVRRRLIRTLYKRKFELREIAQLEALFYAGEI